MGTRYLVMTANGTPVSDGMWKCERDARKDAETRATLSQETYRVGTLADIIEVRYVPPEVQGRVEVKYV